MAGILLAAQSEAACLQLHWQLNFFGGRTCHTSGIVTGSADPLAFTFHSAEILRREQRSAVSLGGDHL